jgi:hypothetical protein
MASITDFCVVHVPLVNEGTDVYRPVPAVDIGSGRYVLLRPDQYDPDDEEWMFLPGDVVTCEKSNRDDVRLLIAASRGNRP